jgi:hypothetical protein
MRVHFGAVPKAKGFNFSGEWTPLWEPGPVLMQMIALPLGMVVSGLLLAAWLRATPVATNPVSRPFRLMTALALLVPVHEALHLIIHPKQGRSGDSVLGIWPSRMLVYAHFDGELSRERFLAVLGMPFLVLSVLPFVVCALAGLSSVTAAYVSCLNAIVAGGDMLAVLVLLTQVPRGAVLRNDAWHTYWRLAQ